MVGCLEASVEVDGGSEKTVDHVGVVIELLVHHEGEDTHLGGTAVVKLLGSGSLLLLGGVHEGQEGDSKVTRGGSLNLLPHSQLPDSDRDEKLEKTESGDGTKAGKTSGDAVEGSTVKVDGARETHTSSGHNVAEDGKHGHAAVLELHKSEAIEAVLVGVIQETKGIPESEGGLGTSLLLESHLQRRGTSNTRSGCECRSYSSRNQN